MIHTSVRGTERLKGIFNVWPSELFVFFIVSLTVLVPEEVVYGYCLNKHKLLLPVGIRSGDVSLSYIPYSIRFELFEQSTLFVLFSYISD